MNYNYYQSESPTKVLVIGIYKFINLNWIITLVTRGPTSDLLYIFIYVLNVHTIIDLGFQTNDFFYLQNDTI